jgi:hypothetical protein
LANRKSLSGSHHVARPGFHSDFSYLLSLLVNLNARSVGRAAVIHGGDNAVVPHLTTLSFAAGRNKKASGANATSETGAFPRTRSLVQTFPGDIATGPQEETAPGGNGEAAGGEQAISGLSSIQEVGHKAVSR